MKLRKVIVKNKFKDYLYLPQESDFEIVEESIPALKPNQFIVKAEFISVDPYMRTFASSFTVPYTQFGFQVGKVIESKNKDFPVNSYVVSHSYWSDYVVLDGDPDATFQMLPYQPLFISGKLKISLAIGALGMPGMTAYLGFLEICVPKRNDVVCVTSAAGAVGSLVGQIARIKHCTVIGLAGTDQKVKLLKNEFRFNHALNYKTSKGIESDLKKVAPDGIDCFFDNVGGQLHASILRCMKNGGRVAVCGAISTYGKPAEVIQTTEPVGVMIESFSFTQWEWAEQLAAVVQLGEWIQKGDIKVKETILNDFESLPKALIALLKGDGVGKVVVKV